MDLYAYSKIGELGELAKANGIEILRLRGYRLMSEETPYTSEQIAEAIEQGYADVYEDMCTTVPLFNINSSLRRFDEYTDRIMKCLLIYKMVDDVDADGNTVKVKRVVGIRWKYIHGKKRRALKLALKQKKKRVLAQLEMFNKYAGQENVLYIHARLGYGNWACPEGLKMIHSNWYLERVNDCWDGSYCDVYAKLDPDTVRVYKESSDDQCVEAD